MNTPMERMLRHAEPTPLACWLWMAHGLGPACSRAAEILAQYGSAPEFYRAACEGDLPPKLTPTQRRRLLESDPLEFEGVEVLCNRRSITILTADVMDMNYPMALRRLPDLPLVLYAIGDVELLQNEHMVGMVGSRRPTPYGLDAAALIGKNLARGGAVIVSGLAAGLDSAAHRAALDNNAPTVAVLGNAIDTTYPPENSGLRLMIQMSGCVVSEYAPGSRSYSSNFLQRNRLIAGLSNQLLVVEARVKSGTMNTVGHAQRYGKQVYAVPASIFNEASRGTNNLLAEGKARAAVDGNEMLRAQGLAGVPAAGTETNAALTPAVQKATRDPLLELIGAKAVTLSVLVQKSGRSISDVLQTLTALELAGLIEALPGSQYRRR